jgi:ectoine hydroxylase-related dioxygenase (phytanoyl-CoA dioxygenase family)
MATLDNDGFEAFDPALGDEVLRELRDTVFPTGEAGMRCLLDGALVQNVALSIGRKLVHRGFLREDAVAIQTIAFDKSAAANWKVTWHQDVMFPFSNRTNAPGFDMPSIKHGVHYSRPPKGILSWMLAVRLHLDRCDADNGPLRVSPGSHTYGVVPSVEIAGVLARHGKVAAVVEEGEVLLMKPLLLHASSKAASVGRRRVLHLVFHDGTPVVERWHRSIGVVDHSPVPMP